MTVDRNSMFAKMVCHGPMKLEFVQPRRDTTTTYYFKCRQCGKVRRGVRDGQGNYGEYDAGKNSAA
jgi:hypothetical protein